jgi:menaquinol-cytochrome c reductase cytochrome b/c subunit
MTALICAISALLDAPLQGPADIAAVPPDHIKAPWIFMGIQVLLRHLSALVAGILIPAVGIFLMILAPYLSKDGSRPAYLLLMLVSAYVALIVWADRFL